MTDPATVPAPPASPPREERALPAAVRRIALAAAGLTVVTRLPRLPTPSVFAFDEVFYANDAADFVREGVVQGRPSHPPVGAWLISLGVRTLGFTPTGWRLAALVAGAALTALAVVLGWRVTRSLAASTLVGLITLTDGIAVVTGRLALLDGFLALATTAAVLAMAGAADRPGDSPWHRRMAWWAAVLLGVGTGIKWSAALLVPVALVVFLLLDLGVWGDLAGRGRRLAGTAAIVLLVPAAVYLAIHVPGLVRYEDTDRAAATCQQDCSVGDRLGGLIDRHEDLVSFHRDLRPENRYAGSSLTWVAQTRPTGLFVQDHESGQRVTVLAAGNPVIWLFGSLALLAAVPLGVRRGQWAPVVVAVCGLAFMAPWVLDRPGYAFYATPVVPLLATSLVWTLTVLVPAARRRGVGVAVAIVAIGGFVATYPVLTGVGLSEQVSEMITWWPGWD